MDEISLEVTDFHGQAVWDCVLEGIPVQLKRRFNEILMSTNRQLQRIKMNPMGCPIRSFMGSHWVSNAIP